MNKQGEVINTRVVSGIPMLNQAATDAVKKWIYEPYRVNSKPVLCRFEVTVKFGI